MQNRRDFEGYRQIRIDKRWVFVVLGFTDDGTCRVIKADGNHEFVPIDAKDRILVNGKRYGRNHWHH